MASENVNKQPKIQNAQYRLLEKLCNACGVSGDEGEVRKIVMDQLESWVDELGVDTLGNVLASKFGKEKKRLKVMIAAHMDEIGFMITHDDGDGLFRFDIVGGIDHRQLPGKPVWIGKDRVPGIIGAKPIHLTTTDERKKTIQLNSLRIDIGPEKKDMVKVGDRATFATSYRRVGPSILAKSLDNRLGVTTLIELVKNSIGNIDLLAAFTVQEEVGLRGAYVAAHTFSPDVAIVIDCTPANDLPAPDDEENVQYNTHLGGGPAIYIADRGTLSDPRLIRHFVKTAESQKIPYQFRQPGGGSTEAAAIHRQRSGIPSISLSVPGRYLHTAVGITRVSDWKSTLALIYAALVNLSPRILTDPR